MGKQKKRVTITDEMAVEMWEMWKSGASYSVIAGQFGCSIMSVSNAVRVYQKAAAMGKEIPPSTSQMTRLAQYNEALDKIVKAILAKSHNELKDEELRNLTVSLAMLTDKVRLLSEEPTAIRRTISEVQEMSDADLERLVKGGVEMEERWKRMRVGDGDGVTDVVVSQERPA